VQLVQLVHQEVHLDLLVIREQLEQLEVLEQLAQLVKLEQLEQQG
jgi:hypothetical protein